MQRSSPCKGAAHIRMWPLLCCLMILDTTFITTPANAWKCCWRAAGCPTSSDAACQADCGWGFNCDVETEWSTTGDIQNFKCATLGLCGWGGWVGMNCGDPIRSGSCNVSYTPNQNDPDCATDLNQCILAEDCPRSFSSTANCNTPTCG